MTLIHDLSDMSVRDQIRVAIYERRPDRYTPGGDDSWLDDIAEEFAPQIAASDAQRRAARSIVGDLEGNATRSTNRILRETLTQPPLDWEFFRNSPLAVGNERVAIRACTAQDFRQFAVEEQARADADYRVREQTVKAAVAIAELMERNSFNVGANIRW